MEADCITKDVIDMLSPECRSQERALTALDSCHLPLGVSLLRQLLALDPNERINAEQALDHEFFGEVELW
jgi:serine/threonine protein kinase